MYLSHDNLKPKLTRTCALQNRAIRSEYFQLGPPHPRKYFQHLKNNTSTDEFNDVRGLGQHILCVIFRGVVSFGETKIKIWLFIFMIQNITEQKCFISLPSLKI